MADTEKNVAGETKAEETKKADDAKKDDKAPVKVKKEKVKFSERVKKFFRDYKAEFKKISWPSREDTFRSTVVVVVSIVLSAVVISILDYLFSQGLTLISHL